MFDNETMGGGAWMWFLVLILLFSNGTGFGNFDRGSIVYGDTPATTTEVNNAVNQQSVNSKLDCIQGAITSSAYENAALINGNSNMINASINNGFQGLSRQLSECCCDIKTQMLQDKYDDVRYQLEQANTAIANAVQTNNILGTMGRWYANQPFSFYGSYGTYGAYPYGTTIA